ncbi:MAG TPA: MBL fold metallo-hydrolase [Deltaproteobacteria bacterium]|nr:MBL fold metallo-hydrolase [Deltaproteobacteria bacterium]HOM30176.1 MBL fold metallo-hydrolase [Deltaproteobacteria bacterium]HPP80378.1 MBL fold metallo-hydrolase [Deltaproteobacteria bacterium]
MVRVTCLGSAGGVTGANFLVETPSGVKVLVDCGLFQGGRRMEMRNWREWDFEPDRVAALLLTHAHIDHSGRIPKLVRDGFKGWILATGPTVELCSIMLLDAAHIQEVDAAWQTRKNRRRAQEGVAPLYTTADAEDSLRCFVTVEEDEPVDVAPGMRARFRNAGHILGSAILELWVRENDHEIKIVFSGDLGKSNKLILKDPAEIFNADYLFVESTYGDRLHKSLEESKAELIEAIRHAYDNREKVIIPAFAVERTQELIYILSEFARNKILPDMPVYIDSPLAIKATEIFRRNKEHYDEEAMAVVNGGADPFSLPNLRYSETTEDSMAINRREGPAIVIAGNGMCTAGRIRHHLKHNLWREGASIVIVGYQANGSTGRKIVEGHKTVRIFGEDVAVKARVFTIGGFSAHADRDDLLAWVSNFAESMPRVFVVHGEPAVADAFARLVTERTGMATHVPRWRERLVLKAREFTSEVPAREEGLADMRSDMLAVISDVERRLAQLRVKIDQPAYLGRITEDEVDRLRYIEEELGEILA